MAKKKKRNPKKHPLRGDVVSKMGKSGKLSRRVMGVTGYSPPKNGISESFFVDYVDHKDKEGRAWCNTWQSWCEKAEIERVAPGTWPPTD